MNNQMDKTKFLEWLDGEDAAVLWEGPDGLMKYDMLVETINSGEFDPDTPPVPTIKPGDSVYHNRFKAQGKVKKLSASGKRAYVVWFDGYAPSYVSLDSLEVVE